MALRNRGARWWSWRRTVPRPRRRSVVSKVLPRLSPERARVVRPRISDPHPAAGDPVPAGRAGVLAGGGRDCPGGGRIVAAQAVDQAVDETDARSRVRHLRGAATGAVGDCAGW